MISEDTEATIRTIVRDGAGKVRHDMATALSEGFAEAIAEQTARHVRAFARQSTKLRD